MRGLKPQLVVSNEAIVQMPPPPSSLPKDGKTEWRRVVPDLIARKVLTDTDLGSLEAYCTAIAGVRETARLITRQGRIVKSPAGPKAHPAVRMQLAYLESARRFAAELGLTPYARQRAAGAPPPGADDDWA
ncbi:MAG: phage terminase small subunit P27 family [Phreatobacter sp.]|uniref:phage terminase small subunit P27 family n=1 Tax=Phreatobacter sp. TaxID=1966341 RepID=UPI001A3D4C3B|nr:phage terminase small subunit P27 family [Phreatobacter sp.]MBL8570947.1 phage terminase small subunit P27 family [Phreatobacter sp.]